MARLATSFVLGYHGCDAEVAKQVVDGNMPLLQSDRDYDWLSPGAYFWRPTLSGLRNMQDGKGIAATSTLRRSSAQ